MLKAKTSTAGIESKDQENIPGTPPKKASELINTIMNLNLIKFLDKFGQMIPRLDVENDRHQKLLFDLFGSLAKKHISDMGQAESDSEGDVRIDYEKYADLDDSSLEAEIEKRYNELLEDTG